MAAVFRRRIKRRKIKQRIIFLLLFIFLILNLDNIARIIYPFSYREETIYYANEYRVDPFLLAAVIKTESNFDSRAVSEKGARGLMQIMPETGEWVARQIGEKTFNPDQLFDPNTSIKLGTWYIADLEKEFSSDTILVLAAYNGGRGNVEEWLDKKSLSGGVNSINQIPFPETRLFVQKVLLYYHIYRYLYKDE
ncbi:MAG: Soluble lytic murein transglycosylase precursor [Pelotomaculum sp. PtaU1.Bin035]|nr:MAG: Soluble lytic murein transglycosylase precursor [Pelotomaculum sp. PtaU1.Bin035]